VTLAARLLSLAVVVVGACAPAPRAPPLGATASTDAGPAVVSVPPAQPRPGVAVDDAGSTDATARSTLAKVCVDPAFLNYESVSVSSDGATLTMCFGDHSSGNSIECFALDLATGVYHDWQKPRPTARPARSTPRRRASPPAFVPARTKDGDLGDAVASPDGSRLFVVRVTTEHAGPENPMPSYFVSRFHGETYDLRTGRRLATFPIEATEQGMNFLSMVVWLDGAHVYMRETQTFEDDATTGRIFDVLRGDETLLGTCAEEDDLVHVSDDLWVFQGGKGLVWQHAGDGRVEHDVDLVTPGTSGPLVLNGRHGEILVFSKALHTWTERGDVLVLDAASGTILRKHSLPKCEPPPAP
jgi:hypothetical protein